MAPKTKQLPDDALLAFANHILDRVLARNRTANHSSATARSLIARGRWGRPAPPGNGKKKDTKQRKGTSTATRHNGGENA